MDAAPRARETKCEGSCVFEEQKPAGIRRRVGAAFFGVQAFCLSRQSPLFVAGALWSRWYTPHFLAESRMMPMAWREDKKTK